MKCIDCELCETGKTPIYLENIDESIEEIQKLKQITFMCKAYHAFILDPFIEKEYYCSLYIPRMKKED